MPINKVRAKFRVNQVVENTYAGGVSTKTLEFSAVGDNNPENSQFSKATPWGDLKIRVEQEETIAFFTPGKEYYLDFTEA